jgi:phosphoribosylaminoimidazole-succinocarboxamide synthase
MAKQLSDIRIEGAGNPYNGKVRDTWTTDDELLIMVTSDRVSAYDHILPILIENKGIVLNKMTVNAFEEMGKRGCKVPHWLLQSPHPRVLIGHHCRRFDVEVIIRAYIAGSLWRDYEKGKREFWGTVLPDGLKENQRLPELMVTPTTKADSGHDENITEEEILTRKLCTAEEWDHIRECALELFQFGTEMSAEQGLILVDTKYEFGIDKNGIIRLIDEIHTSDSSRFFYIKEYAKKLKAGEKQNHISKEFVREWLKERNFMGKDGQTMPVITKTDKKSFRDKYYEFSEAILGKNVTDSIRSISDANNNDAIEQSIASGLYEIRKAA